MKRLIKNLMFVMVVVSLSACNPGDLNKVLGAVLEDGAGLTDSQIGSGLKEALTQGISKGADRLSVRDGFLKGAYKILLPDEVQKVTSRLSGIPGFTQVENKMLELVNRGAEDAAKTAKPIFVSAIKQMSFRDAVGILMGGNNAATDYLKSATQSKLYTAFKPEIVKSLDKVNATSTWNKAVTTYNKIPLVNKVNPDLDDYVTNKALDGLFQMVAKEEANIRKNPAARVTDLMKQVFAKQDNK